MKTVLVSCNKCGEQIVAPHVQVRLEFGDREIFGNEIGVTGLPDIYILDLHKKCADELWAQFWASCKTDWTDATLR